jgi:ribose transport system substrate-binding protein
MKNFGWLMSVLLLAGVGLAGYGGGDQARAADGATAAPVVGANEDVKLAFVTNNAADFWTAARAGCEKAAKDIPHVSVEFRLVPDASASTQKQIVDDLLAAGVKGIAISPIDPANQTEMLNGVAAQGVLVTQDSDAPQSNRMCYVGTDNHAAGLQAGELIKKALPEGGKIMVFVGNMGAQNAQDRLAGIKDAIAGTKIEIIDIKTDGTDIVKAKSNATDTIVAYPDVAGLVGLWSYNGPAILGAVKDAEKVGKIKIVCFDGDEDTLQGVKDGGIFGTVVQQPDQFGYKAVETMNKALRGDKSGVPADKRMVIPTLAITKDGIDDYLKGQAAMKGK